MLLVETEVTSIITPLRVVLHPFLPFLTPIMTEVCLQTPFRIGALLRYVTLQALWASTCECGPGRVCNFYLSSTQVGVHTDEVCDCFVV